MIPIILDLQLKATQGGHLSYVLWEIAFEKLLKMNLWMNEWMKEWKNEIMK